MSIKEIPVHFHKMERERVYRSRYRKQPLALGVRDFMGSVAAAGAFVTALVTIATLLVLLTEK